MTAPTTAGLTSISSDSFISIGSSSISARGAWASPHGFTTPCRVTSPSARPGGGRRLQLAGRISGRALVNITVARSDSQPGLILLKPSAVAEQLGRPNDYETVDALGRAPRDTAQRRLVPAQS